MPIQIKIIFILCMLAAFALGCMLSMRIIISLKLKGEIVIDKEHYEHPATFFKMNLTPEKAFNTKYVMFRVTQGDLRDKFGPDIKLTPEDFEDERKS